MKRKLLSLTLAAVLALSLTACGGGGSDTTTTDSTDAATTEESTDAAECRRQRNRKFLFQPEDQLLYAIDGRVVIYRQKDYNYIFAAKSCDSDIFTIKILVKKLGNRLKRCVFFLREKNSKMKKLGIRQKRCGSQQVLPVFIGAPFLQIAGK